VRTFNQPDFARFRAGSLCFDGESRHNERVHAEDIVERVAITTGLPRNVAARVVDDVLTFYRQSAEHYVRVRHTTLQAEGKNNDQIFSLIAGELTRRLVAAPQLSERQLRRIVYG
jgi:hypothetical protein